jgi:hypothetical protein
MRPNERCSCRKTHWNRSHEANGNFS